MLSRLREQTRLTLEQLSRGDANGATPDAPGITATLLERLNSRRLAERLAPLAPGGSYRYRITEGGARVLLPRE